MKAEQEKLLQALTDMTEQVTAFRNTLDIHLAKVTDAEWWDKAFIYMPLSRITETLGRLELDLKQQIRRMA